jgi:hypothetical protein
MPYYRRVLRTRPIAYWRQDESSGATARDCANGFNGSYTGVDLGHAGIGDGRSAPWYDGSGDYTSLWSAGLAAALNPAEGSLMCWGRVNSAAVWTDGTARYLIHFWADANNQIYIARASTNNVLLWQYDAGGVPQAIPSTAFGGLADWLCAALTWSKSAGVNGEVKAYMQGAQVGATQTGLGNWVGTIATAQTLIGARTNGPANVWHGWLAHAALWDRALSPAEMAALARV